MAVWASLEVPLLTVNLMGFVFSSIFFHHEKNARLQVWEKTQNINMAGNV
jgi:hypothetical protein